jgi:hypothetical protein
MRRGGYRAKRARWCSWVKKFHLGLFPVSFPSLLVWFGLLFLFRFGYLARFASSWVYFRLSCRIMRVVFSETGFFVCLLIEMKYEYMNITYQS